MARGARYREADPGVDPDPEGVSACETRGDEAGAMKLYTYSAHPFVFDRARVYADCDSFKPTGLWVSVEGFHDDVTWPDWCRDEDFSPGGLAHRTEIVLTDDAHVLRIDNIDTLDRFAETYNDPHHDAYYSARRIAWPRVVREWQ